MWVLPREVVGSADWLASLWERRSVLTGIDMIPLWGMRDIAFPSDSLDVWVEESPQALVERLAEVGHFPALEATDRLVLAVRSTDSLS